MKGRVIKLSVAFLLLAAIGVGLHEHLTRGPSVRGGLELVPAEKGKTLSVSSVRLKGSLSPEEIQSMCQLVGRLRNLLPFQTNVTRIELKSRNAWQVAADVDIGFYRVRCSKRMFQDWQIEK